MVLFHRIRLEGTCDKCKAAVFVDANADFQSGSIAVFDFDWLYYCRCGGDQSVIGQAAVSQDKPLVKLVPM